jgi:hypothetical protein
MVLKNQGDLPLPENPVGLPSGSKFMRGGKRPGTADEPQVVLGNRAARRALKKQKGAAPPVQLIPAPPPVHVEAEPEVPAPPMGAVSPSLPSAQPKPKAAKPAPAKTTPVKAAPVKKAAAAKKAAPAKKAAAAKKAAPAKKAAAAKKATPAKKAAAKKSAPVKKTTSKKTAAKKAAPAKKAAAKKAVRRKK